MTYSALSVSDIRSKAVKRRIESFRKRFGETHLYLAQHAALPPALTPDLLYRLWANFQRDIDSVVLNIPWIAVADLLLSNLCDEVGQELYEIDEAVRKELLRQLKEDSRFGQNRIQELSDFLIAYVGQQLNSPDLDTRDFAETQRWTALAHKQPAEAASEIRATLSKLKPDDKTEWIRMAKLLETLAEPLSEFQWLLSYAYAMANFARGDLEAARAQLSEVVETSNELQMAEASLPIPEEIKATNTKTALRSASFLNKYHRLIGIGRDTVAVFLVLIVGAFCYLSSTDRSPNTVSKKASSVAFSPKSTPTASPPSPSSTTSTISPSLKPTLTASLPSLSPTTSPTTPIVPSPTPILTAPSPASTPTPIVPSPTPIPSASPPATPNPTPPSSPGLTPEGLGQEIYTQVNLYRASRSLPPLSLDPQISEIAREHSHAMASGQTPFAHEDLNQLAQKIDRVVPNIQISEIVTYKKGYKNPAQRVVQDWLEDPGERSNLEGPYNMIGIGVSENGKGEFYSTQIFIRTR